MAISYVDPYGIKLDSRLKCDRQRVLLIDRESNPDTRVSKMQAWMERSSRQTNSSTIRHQLSSGYIKRNRYYIKSIAEVVQFLAVNELAFRGNNECSNEEAQSHENIGGLFNKLSEFAMSRN